MTWLRVAGFLILMGGAVAYMARIARDSGGVAQSSFDRRCFLCGHPDHRHRIIDAIVERLYFDEDFHEVIADYGYSTEKFIEVAIDVFNAEQHEDWKGESDWTLEVEGTTLVLIGTAPRTT